MDRLLDFLNKWISPFTITAAIGFIIWLVQLNSAILNLSERTSVVETAHIHHVQDNQSLAVLVSRVSAVQESLAFQLDRLEQRMTRNEGLIYNNQGDHEHGE